MATTSWPKDPRIYRWLIDGHNAIFSHPDLEALQVEGSRGEARRRLESIVERFSAIQGIDILIVYDGNRMERNPDARKLGRVQTVYSNGPDEEADDRIVMLASSWLRDGARVAVVTSDRATLASRLPSAVRIVPPAEVFRRARPAKERGGRGVPDGDFSDIEGYFLSLPSPVEPPLPDRHLSPPPSPRLPPPVRSAPPPRRPQADPGPAGSPATPVGSRGKEGADQEKKKLRGLRAQARRLASYGKKKPRR